MDNPYHNLNPVIKLDSFGNRRKRILLTIGGLIFVAFFYFSFVVPPSLFPVDSIITIKKGSSLRSVSGQLETGNYINSRALFETLVILRGGEKVISGDYYFNKPISVFAISKRISQGKRNLKTVRITIHEGLNIDEISEVYSGKLINFDKEGFLEKASGLEGYLFPDTYFFTQSDNEDVVIETMSKNFDKIIAPHKEEIEIKNLDLAEVIIMASIIEKEASGNQDREYISGILWKRLSIGMPLQVDVAPITYKEKGLPERPISSPGEKSIIAAINPTESKYLYYLHQKNGDIHFAKTYKEHLDNIDKYLR